MKGWGQCRSDVALPLAPAGLPSSSPRLTRDRDDGEGEATPDQRRPVDGVGNEMKLGLSWGERPVGAAYIAAIPNPNRWTAEMQSWL